MPLNSRAKGADAERELAKVIAELFGITARRGQQFSGSPDSPDVVAWPGVHIECKRTEALRLYPAMAQAERDCGDKVPVVIHRRSRDSWMLTVRLDRLNDLIEAATAAERQE